MQTELVKKLFGEFLTSFQTFFTGCESHFVNEMVTNMYSRIFEGHKDIVKYRKDFKEVYFIVKGQVVMRQIDGMKNSFCLLPTYSTFGDFHCLYNCKAGFYYTALAGSNS